MTRASVGSTASSSTSSSRGPGFRSSSGRTIVTARATSRSTCRGVTRAAAATPWTTNVPVELRGRPAIEYLLHEPESRDRRREPLLRRVDRLARGRAQPGLYARHAERRRDMGERAARQRRPRLRARRRRSVPHRRSGAAAPIGAEVLYCVTNDWRGNVSPAAVIRTFSSIARRMGARRGRWAYA